MKGIVIALSVLLAVCQVSYAQKCLTSQKVQQSIANNQEAAKRVAEIAAFTKDYIENDNRSANKTTVVHRIPVVIHVLYKNASQNISDAQIMSQFVVLNEAFSNTNASAANVPAQFKVLAANAEMEFCIARIAPDGSATTGIIRKEVGVGFDGENDYYNAANGGTPPWDPNKYLNVYLVQLAGGNLGFTYIPGSAPLGEEGVVIDTKAWGTVGTAANNQPSHLGTTAVHEFGHYFNLEHIWGANNGGCGDDDGVTDTPPQDQESSGCGTFPETDNCSPSGNGIMFMNYMDYSDDVCVSMFTQGQKQRMKAAIAGPRSLLASSLSCNPVSIPNVAIADFSIVPNPANDYVLIRLAQTEAYSVEVYNSTGQLLLSENATDTQLRIETGHLTTGWYFVRVSNQKATSTKKLFIAH